MSIAFVRLWTLHRCVPSLRWQSPNGKYLACGAIDGVVTIFDVAAGGKRLHTLESTIPVALPWMTFSVDHAMAVRSLTFSADSKELITASDDMHVNIYDVEHASLIGSLSGHSAWVLSVAAHPTSKQIATGYEFLNRFLTDCRA